MDPQFKKLVSGINKSLASIVGTKYSGMCMQTVEKMVILGLKPDSSTKTMIISTFREYVPGTLLGAGDLMAGADDCGDKIEKAFPFLPRSTDREIAKALKNNISKAADVIDFNGKYMYNVDDAVKEAIDDAKAYCTNTARTTFKEENLSTSEKLMAGIIAFVIACGVVAVLLYIIFSVGQSCKVPDLAKTPNESVDVTTNFGTRVYRGATYYDSGRTVFVGSKETPLPVNVNTLYDKALELRSYGRREEPPQSIFGPYKALVPPRTWLQFLQLVPTAENDQQAIGPVLETFAKRIESIQQSSICNNFASGNNMLSSAYLLLFNSFTAGIATSALTDALSGVPGGGLNVTLLTSLWSALAAIPGVVSTITVIVGILTAYVQKFIIQFNKRFTRSDNLIAGQKKKALKKFITKMQIFKGPNKVLYRNIEKFINDLYHIVGADMGLR